MEERLTVYSLLLIAIFSFVPAHANPLQDGACAASRDLYAALTVRNISPETKGGMASLPDVFGVDGKLVIGFAHNGHAYIAINGARFEAKGIGGFPMSVSTMHRRLNHNLNEGVLLHFPDIPQSTLEDLTKSLMQARRSRHISCLHAVCSLIEENSDLKIPGMHVTASGIYEILLARGILGKDGTQYRAEIFQFGYITPARIGERYRSEEKGMIVIYAVIASAVGVTTGGIYILSD